MENLLSKPDRIIKRYYLYLHVSWTLIVIISLALTLYHNNRNTLKYASIEARTYFDLNKFYRTVMAGLGGVYVPVSNIAPNPYLLVPDRDITATDGRKLTLVNPSYMTRIVFEQIKKGSEEPVLNKITSLKTLNPINNPDVWEKATLHSFEKGGEEAMEVANINGQPYLRLMKPFFVEASCLKCHAHQGYSVGDVRGGISIAVPLRPFYAAERQTRNIIIVTHLLLWVLVTGTLVTFTRHTIKNARAYEETKSLSLHDPLTGLANRRFMELDLEESFDLSERYGNQLSAIMADIDYFKDYNDRHGHKAGDNLLSKVAGIISMEIRKTDLAVRYGGEEFFILLHQTGITEAVEVAERIRKNIGNATGVTISLGVTAYHKGMTKKEEIVINADQAMYEAKNKGRNRVEVVC
ncbi:MAG: diguanylate cyclase [Deltaproteobacteria bacterium]|nr:diguanylate cyclase [Deltaproteobacteria bacterium]